MARVLALGLAAAVLPACGSPEKLWVINAGVSDAVVRVHWTETEEDDDDDDDYTVERTLHYYDEWVVPAGRADGRKYYHLPLDVQILRVTDGFVLYQGSLEADKFEEDQSQVEFTVYP